MANHGTILAALQHFSDQLGITFPQDEYCRMMDAQDKGDAKLVLWIALISVLTEIRNAIQALKPAPANDQDVDLENPPL